MIGTVFDKVSSLFGRAFVVTGLAPVAALVMASLLAMYLSAGSAPILTRWKALGDLQMAAALVALFAVVVAAYLLVILLPVMRRYLENYHPLWFLTARAKRNTRLKFRKLRQAADAAAANVAKAQADQQAFELAAAAAIVPPDDDLVPEDRAQATALYGEMLLLDEAANDPSLTKLKEISERLVELRKQGKDETLDKAQALAISLWQRRVGAVQREYEAALQRLWWRFSKLDDERQIMATRLGNIIRSSEAHAYLCYGIDTEVIWPRLLPVVPAEQAKRLEDQGAAYDFAIAMTWLSALFGALWLGVLACEIWKSVAATGGNPWVGLAVLAGAAASYAFYLSALAAARTLGRLVESSVDVYRFKLLAELRIAMPKSLNDERQTWQRIAKLIVYGEDDYLIYQKDAPKAGA